MTAEMRYTTNHHTVNSRYSATALFTEPFNPLPILCMIQFKRLHIDLGNLPKFFKQIGRLMRSHQGSYTWLSDWRNSSLAP